MKYLECPPISELDLRLHSGIIVGDYKVNGRVEIYSCKLAPSEKRLANSLDKQLAVELSGSQSGSLEDSPFGGSPGNPFNPAHSSLSPASASPLGSATDSATRKLLINLILTLNTTFSDYDFRDLKPEDFIREGSLDLVQNSINSKLSRGEEDSSNVEFYQRLWSSLDDEMSLKECEIYSYVNDMDDDALSVGKIWSVNYFLYNKKLKKLAFLACWIKTPGISQDDSDEGMESDDDGMEWAMDEQD